MPRESRSCVAFLHLRFPTTLRIISSRLRASARPPPLSTPPLAPTASGPTMRFPFRFFGGNGCHPHHMGWWGKNATGQLLMRRNGRYRLTCQVFVERMSHRPKKEEQHEGAQGADAASLAG